MITWTPPPRHRKDRSVLEETLRRPIVQSRLQIELALLTSHCLGRAVLRPVGEPGTGLPRPEA